MCLSPQSDARCIGPEEGPIIKLALDIKSHNADSGLFLRSTVPSICSDAVFNPILANLYSLKFSTISLNFSLPQFLMSVPTLFVCLACIRIYFSFVGLPYFIKLCSNLGLHKDLPSSSEGV